MPSKLKDLFSTESVLYNKLVLGVYIRIKKGVVVLFDGMFADLIEKRKIWMHSLMKRLQE